MSAAAAAVVGVQKVGHVPRTPRKPKFKAVISKSIPFTPDVAQWYLSLPAYEAERPIDYDQVGFYHRMMMEGGYRNDDAKIVTAKCKWDGSVRKVDGQHLCTARMKAVGINFERVYGKFETRHVQYLCDTVENFVNLYNHIQDAKPRSQDHITKMVATLCKDWYDGEKGIEAIKSVITGLRYWMDPGLDLSKNSRRMLPEYAVQIVKNDTFLLDAARLAVQTIAHARKQPTKVHTSLQNQAIAAALMECFTSRHEAKAIEFFDRYLEMDFASAAEVRVTYNWVSKYLTSDPRTRISRTKLDWFNGFVTGFRGYYGTKPLTKIQRPKKPGRVHVSICNWDEYWKTGKYR